jgi:hypothetical protein
MAISEKRLRLIAKKHNKAWKIIPTVFNPNPNPLGPCDDSCTILWELGIPCYHIILTLLESNQQLIKRGVYSRWYLRKPSSDPYRKILDPKIVTCLSGRPKNTAQPVPAHLSAGIQLPRRGGNLSLGSGNSTGRRASGQRLQPSIRRRRSHWEEVEDQPRIVRRSKTKRRPMCSRCGQYGHRSTSKTCPSRVKMPPESPRPRSETPSEDPFAISSESSSQAPSEAVMLIGPPIRWRARVTAVRSEIFAYRAGCWPSGIPDGRIFQWPRNPSPDRKYDRSLASPLRKLCAYRGILWC